MPDETNSGEPIIDTKQRGQGFTQPAGVEKNRLGRLFDKWVRDPRTTALSVCSLLASVSYIYYHPEVLQNTEHLMPHVLNAINSVGLLFSADSRS